MGTVFEITATILVCTISTLNLHVGDPRDKVSYIETQFSLKLYSEYETDSYINFKMMKSKALEFYNLLCSIWQN